MYMPAIIDARHVRSYQVGPYLTMLFTDCKSAGQIQYRHVLFVYAPPDPRQPRHVQLQRIMAVAAERNAMLDKIPDTPKKGHFLGVFPGEGHMNMGMSEDWDDLEKFAQKALELLPINIWLQPRRISCRRFRPASMSPPMTTGLGRRTRHERRNHH